jgi:glycine/D-amino acid oxidase-like deaminating enzyme
MAGADVVIIGGGVMGLFTALALVERGAAGRIVLLEKRFVGAGSSGKSGAILRQHYSHETTVRMARHSLAVYRSFRERTGHDIGFTDPGMLFLCHERDRAALEANVTLQQRLDVAVEAMDAAALRGLVTDAVIEDEVCGAFEREAAFVDPGDTLDALAALARAGGVEVREGAAVTDVVVTDGGVRGVGTSDGATIETGVVINAGGPWAGLICRRLGVDVPLRAIRPEQAFFVPPPGLVSTQVVCGDLVHGLYWKPERAGRLRVGNMAYAEDREVPDPDDYDEGVSNAFIESCRARISARVPELARAVSWGGCGALYTVTPDAHALIGPVPGVDGLFLASGFSGHGFKLGPAVGAGLAALATGAAPPEPFDPAFFAVDRFDREATHTTGYRFGILG